MANIEIRTKARSQSVKLWQIADCLGVTDSTFSRKLRKELPESEKTRILEIIDKLSTETKETV